MTKIEWTDETWNPIRGCSRVSEGCRNCYAERQAARFSGAYHAYHGLVRITKSGPQWTGKVIFDDHTLLKPLRWKKPRRVFVNSMSDLFHEGVSIEWLDRIFAVMALASHHTFQVLTKRPERMRDYCTASDTRRRVALAMFDTIKTIKAKEMWMPLVQRADSTVESPKFWAEWPLPNIWLGVSVEDQKTADERIPLLLETAAVVRWVSYEPALGPVDFRNLRAGTFDAMTGCGDRERLADWDATPRLDWIVCGGESGPGARPMHPTWARSVREQCQSEGVSFFFKQWGAWLPGSANGFTQWPEIDHSRPILMPAHPGRAGFDEHQVMLCMGKKKAGRLLDGREWSEYPTTSEA